MLDGYDPILHTVSCSRYSKKCWALIVAYLVSAKRLFRCRLLFLPQSCCCSAYYIHLGSRGGRAGTPSPTKTAPLLMWFVARLSLGLISHRVRHKFLVDSCWLSVCCSHETNVSRDPSRVSTRLASDVHKHRQGTAAVVAHAVFRLSAAPATVKERTVFLTRKWSSFDRCLQEATYIASVQRLKGAVKNLNCQQRHTGANTPAAAVAVEYSIRFACPINGF